MKNDPGLLDVLACPSCKGRLQYTSGEKLLCDACRLVFDVKDGVPVLLVEEAEPAD
ncbi:MAG TPA: Trm112 family protein [Deltaproteobacteria bacterium]|nr:Trm112 family protein [Candidatus Binatota bacterium]HIL12751.1 Trm112 family protein [Deltaproteobacteria bacterium]